MGMKSYENRLVDAGRGGAGGDGGDSSWLWGEILR